MGRVAKKNSDHRGKLWILAALGLGVAAWSAFLWRELVKARLSGAEPFCAFGDAGTCGALWDAPFASAVQRWTAVPVAGWGVVWGIAAFVLPLVVLFGSKAAGRSKGWAATRLVGLLGLVGVGALLLASAAAGLFCSSCAVVYVLAGLYGALALSGGYKATGDKTVAGKAAESGAGLGAWRGASPLVLAAFAGAFLLVLVPGLRTPKNAQESALKALAAASQAGAPAASPPAASDPGASDLAPSSAAPEAGPLLAPGPKAGQGMPAEFTQGSGTGDADRDAKLVELIGNLQPELKQALSDALLAYSEAPSFAPAPPRTVEGPADAPVKIVEFTDTLCNHCATLHETLAYLRQISPAGSFSVERRHYPLDGHCNPELVVRGPESVRCLAARAKICMEGREGAEAFTVGLYREQQTLTPGRVFEMGNAYIDRGELAACISSKETERKLQDDIRQVALYQPRGTPVILVNGRVATNFPPFLYGLILTSGVTHHPAFAVLPAPERHEGHDH